jgi:hypothetical protein
MRENRKSGSMSGLEKPGYGWATEALPEETGSERIGSTYRHGVLARLYSLARKGRKGMKAEGRGKG